MAVAYFVYFMMGGTILCDVSVSDSIPSGISTVSVSDHPKAEPVNAL